MSERTPPRLGFLAVTTVLFGVAMAAAAVGLWPVYRTGQFVAVAAGALLAGSVIALVGAVLRASAASLMIATFAVFLVLGVPLAVPDEAALGFLPTVDGLFDLLAGVALGWRQLLTITLPVGSYEALLVPAFALLLTASVAGLSVGLRARYGELGVVAPIIVFVTAVLFGPEEPVAPAGVALALLATILLWIVWRRWYRRREAIRRLSGGTGPRTPQAVREHRFVGVRTLAAAAALLLVCGAGATSVAALLPPSAERTVLRTTVERPFDPRDVVSPLAGFRRYLMEPLADAVLLEVSGMPAGSRLRLATLDTYDGVVYGVGAGDGDNASGTFTRVPYRVERDPGDGRPVELRVRVTGYEDVWLPAVGLPAEVRFSGAGAEQAGGSLYLNEVTGTAAVRSGIGPGAAYVLRAALPDQPAEGELEGLTPGGARVPATVPLPDAAADRLDQYTDEGAAPGRQLVQMLAGLARDGYISHGLTEDEPPSRSGHSLDRIADLFTAPLMVGDAEQYAVAAALMARELGFPARVVVGFAPEVDDGGEARVRGADVSAWIEVHTSEHGWVSLDPVPQPRDIPDELPEEPAPVSRPQTVVPPLVEEDDDRQEPPAVESSTEDPDDTDPLLAVLLAVLAAAGWTALALAVLLSPVAAILAAKVRRRRLRRSRGTARDRIRGGWEEYADAALDHGVEIPPGATRTEAAGRIGGRRPVLLAGITDRAVFAPEEPGADDAARVWVAVDELRAALGSGLTRRQRLRAAVSLRSLRGRARLRAAEGRSQ